VKNVQEKLEKKIRKRIEKKDDKKNRLKMFGYEDSLRWLDDQIASRKHVELKKDS
jgi:hypothetical protein